MNPSTLLTTIRMSQPGAAYELLARHLPTYDAQDRRALGQCARAADGNWANIETRMLLSDILLATQRKSPWPAHPSPLRLPQGRTLVVFNPHSEGNQLLRSWKQERAVERSRENAMPAQRPSEHQNGGGAARFLKRLIPPVIKRAIDAHRRAQDAADVQEVRERFGLNAGYVPTGDFLRRWMTSNDRGAVTKPLKRDKLGETEMIISNPPRTVEAENRATLTRLKIASQFIGRAPTAETARSRVSEIMLFFSQEKYQHLAAGEHDWGCATSVHILARDLYTHLKDPQFVEQLRRNRVIG